TVDGADEVDPELNLIKGYGGALLREKIVAAASKRVLILVGPEKQVPVLGSRGRLPVEVVPFGHGRCAKQLGRWGCPGTVRLLAGRPFLTDNGNLILDCAVRPIRDPAELDSQIRSIPGVVATGIFAGMADLVLVQDTKDVRILERPRKK
ncbi:MAG TPA: ribose 5-phosphate isomerase A, partial [Planctomycetota bacterium]|nr:ribose 5-phosphate isomerase A [Planctomycetota bacterium]